MICTQPDKKGYQGIHLNHHSGKSTLIYKSALLVLGSLNYLLSVDLISVTGYEVKGAKKNRHNSECVDSRKGIFPTKSISTWVSGSNFY